MKGLAKIGWMLDKAASTRFAPEAHTAVKMALEKLQAEGYGSFMELLQSVGAEQASPPKTSAQRSQLDEDYASLVRSLLRHPDFETKFNDWERKLIGDLSFWARAFSEKQRRLIEKYAQRAGLLEAA
jgi:hypothetical protein